MQIPKDFSHFKLILKKIEDVRQGDIILTPQGEVKTSPAPKRSPDGDVTIWGDSWHAGARPVAVLLPPVWEKGKIVGYGARGHLI